MIVKVGICFRSLNKPKASSNFDTVGTMDSSHGALVGRSAGKRRAPHRDRDACELVYDLLPSAMSVEAQLFPALSFVRRRAVFAHKTRKPKRATSPRCEDSYREQRQEFHELTVQPHIFQATS